MHSISEFGANVPAFLAKLWKLVDDSETNELICWSEEGTSFFIRDQAQFSRKLLPMYYKHNNMASFIRQLNMYGFHKIVSADAGSLRLDKDEMEFAHQCFLRGHPYLLEHIKRKVGKSQLLTSQLIEEGKEGSNGGVMVKADFMNKILSEVKLMRGRQDTVEGRLTSMKQENEALWRELSLLRQKHIKQQNIVNKLIQFLVTLVQPSQRFGKRRYPLMINSVAHPSDQSDGKDTSMNSDAGVSQSTTRPTIHELDGDVILPDTNQELLSNTIILPMPDSGFADVIDSSLEPEVLSPDPDVLDCLQPCIIPDPLNDSSVHVLEVNSFEPEALGDKTVETSPLSPEMLLAVPPSELNPAIIVPRLQISKSKSTNLTNSQLSNTKAVTQSPSTAPSPASIPVVARKNQGNGSKAAPLTNRAVSITNQGIPSSAMSDKSKTTIIQPTVKRDLRVLAPRNRRKKRQNTKDSLMSECESIDNMVKPVDLLTEAGLADFPPSDASTSSTSILNLGSANSTVGGPLTPSTHSHLVVFPKPESPIPIVHSPVASPTAPSSHCSVTQPASMSLPSDTTITDVTSPLVVYPPSNSTPGVSSPQVSPGLTSPYDMTLACTSQSGSSSTNKSSPFNRDELDFHVGAMESEISQLKDLLNCSGIQMDANTLLGLFSNDDSNFSMSESDKSSFNSKLDSSGNELMYYQPDFLDLENIWNTEYNRSTPSPTPMDILSEVNTPIAIPSSPGFQGPATKKRRT